MTSMCGKSLKYQIEIVVVYMDINTCINCVSMLKLLIDSHIIYNTFLFQEKHLKIYGQYVKSLFYAIRKCRYCEVRADTLSSLNIRY